MISPAPVAAENPATATPAGRAGAGSPGGSFGDLLATKLSTSSPASPTAAAGPAAKATAISSDATEKPAPGPAAGAKVLPDGPEKKKPATAVAPPAALLGMLSPSAVPVPAASPTAAVDAAAGGQSSSSPAAGTLGGPPPGPSSASSPEREQNPDGGSPPNFQQLSTPASPRSGATALPAATGTLPLPGLGQDGTSPGEGSPLRPLPGTSAPPATAEGLSALSGGSTAAQGKQASATQATCAAGEKQTATAAPQQPSWPGVWAEGCSVSPTVESAAAARTAPDQPAQAAPAKGANDAASLAAATTGKAAGEAAAAPAASQTPASVAATPSAASALLVSVTTEAQKPAAEAPEKGASRVETAPAELKPSSPQDPVAVTAAGGAGQGAKAADNQQPKPPQAPSGGSGQNPRSPVAADGAAAAVQSPAPGPAGPHPAPGPTPPAAPAIPLAELKQATPQNTTTNPDQGNAPLADASQPADLPAPLPVMVSTAHVLERMGHSEIRVDVNTADFGNVQLLTSVSQDRVGATISTAHIDLRTAMMAEAPSLQQALEQHHLRLGQLELGTQAGGRQGGGTAQQQPRPQSGWQTGVPAPLAGDPTQSQSQDSPAPSLVMTPGSSRLNIHA